MAEIKKERLALSADLEAQMKTEWYGVMKDIHIREDKIHAEIDEQYPQFKGCLGRDGSNVRIADFRALDKEMCQRYGELLRKYQELERKKREEESNKEKLSDK